MVEAASPIPYLAAMHCSQRRAHYRDLTRVQRNPTALAVSPSDHLLGIHPTRANRGVPDHTIFTLTTFPWLNCTFNTKELLAVVRRCNTSDVHPLTLATRAPAHPLGRLDVFLEPTKFRTAGESGGGQKRLEHQRLP